MKFKEYIEEYLNEEIGPRFWNGLIDKINRKYYGPKPYMMLRKVQDSDLHAVIMINTFNDFPKEFVELVKKSAKNMGSGEKIDTKDKKIVLNTENWKNVYRNIVKS